MSGSRSTQPSRGGGGAAAQGRRRPASSARVPIVPDVYQEMLRESGVAASTGRKKRRKTDMCDGDDVIDTAWPKPAPHTAAPRSIPAHTEKGERSRGPVEGKQVLDDDDDEDGGDDSEDSGDVDWEDVDLGATLPLDLKPAEPETLEVVLNDLNVPKKPSVERKKVTAVDRKIRLEAHKLHLLCLLAHISLRNRWCNDESIQVSSYPSISLQSLLSF